jgi:uncharacterized protein with FMN-binding domain
MLSRVRKHTSLISKLLLSGALIAVSLAYGWWQRHYDAGPDSAAASMPLPLAANVPPATTAKPLPAASAPEAPVQAAREPGVTTQAAPSQQAASATPPLTAMAMLRMYQPPAPQPPLALVTGVPDPGAAAPVPAGTHLMDGDYLSTIEQYEWGDLQVKISIEGGQIRAAVLTLYPDHRTESLDISKRAAPILDSEVIKTQASKVDVVSSATDTSYAFRDAVASVLTKAAR